MQWENKKEEKILNIKNYILKHSTSFCTEVFFSIQYIMEILSTYFWKYKAQTFMQGPCKAQASYSNGPDNLVSEQLIWNGFLAI